MEKLDKLIPRAVKVLKKYGIVENNIYPGQFNGYISSFGAAINQSGLLPAVVFFAKDERAEDKRSHLLRVIRDLLDEDDNPQESTIQYTPMDMYEYIKNVSEEGRSMMNMMEQKIILRATAVKLALRLFQKKNDHGEN